MGWGAVSASAEVKGGLWGGARVAWSGPGGGGFREHKEWGRGELLREEEAQGSMGVWVSRDRGFGLGPCAVNRRVSQTGGA